MPSIPSPHTTPIAVGEEHRADAADPFPAATVKPVAAQPQPTESMFRSTGLQGLV